MPYYRHKIIANNKSYKPLKCQEFDTTPPKYTWRYGARLDVAFQAKDIERQYRVCTSSERRWNIQLAAFLYLATSACLLLYFVIDFYTSSTSTNEDLIYVSVASLVASFGLIIISFTIGFHHSLTLSSFFTLVVGFIIPIILLHFGTEIHPVHMIFVWTCPLLVSYSLLYLPLLLLVVMGVLYSIGFVLAANLSLSLSTDRSILESVLMFVVLFGVNLVCAVTRFYDEISSRRVFYKIGRSLIYRQQALEETLLKEVLIQSIMPPGVCNQILHSGMLHDVVLCKDSDNMMRDLPIRLMEPVSILFADLVGFTAMSSNLTAPELVSLLTDLYGRFDCVAEAYNCENISILGDCYFAVSGCPEPDERHADNCMYTGVGLIKATREFCIQRDKSIDIRVGIHTGIVLCGIVGGTKFKYDVWSSDAKTANYMESGGVPGRVHISEETKKFLKDSWEFEEGFGSKREPELQGIRTFLLKTENQETVVIEPKKKDITESIIYKTIQKKRGSSVASKEFDGTVALQHIITNEELHSGYSLLPILHPSISLEESKGPRLNGNSYKCMSHAAVSPVENGTVENGNKILEDTPRSSKDRQEIQEASQKPWDIHQIFRKMTNSSEEKTGLPGMAVNPMTTEFRSSRVALDHQKHGWSEMGCACMFSRGFSFLSFVVLATVSCCIAVLILTNISSVPIIVVEVVVNLVVVVVMVVLLLRWNRIKQLAFLENVHRMPYNVLPTTASLLIVFGCFAAVVLSCYEPAVEYNKSQFMALPILLLLTHFLIFNRSNFLIQMILLTLSFGGTVAFFFVSRTFTDGPTVLKDFGIIASLCLYLTLIALLWVKSLKSTLRFGTLHECSTELAVMKEEERVTTALFNTIIPKHVSDQFLTELRYSHSYDKVGCIFASVTNFWDFYEEKFEGGMGCIRVLNEIIRDLDDMLSSVNDIRKSDPRWRAIQKIKTVGSCYMAASGLDPLTEEQTRQGNHEHIVHLMDFCFKILETIKQFNTYTFGTKFTMKIGFNYGPVTDGIIGQNKVLYDIWGDTVNLSSRMMSTGVVGRIQLPASVVPYLIDHFKCPKRGKVFIKGKGEMITHFCVGKKTPEQIKSNLASRDAKRINSSDAS